MRVLLTGASGLLGTSLMAELTARGHFCLGISQSQIWSLVRDKDSSFLKNIDVCIHAGANTNVEQCELNPDKCYEDNYFLSEQIAQKCSIFGVKLVFISSTGVYGSHKAIPYTEYDEVYPTTVHHRSKYLAELASLAVSAKNLIIRTGWLFGGPTTNPKNFVYNRLSEAKSLVQNNKKMMSNSDQFGNPTYVNDVSKQLIMMIERDCSGVFNVTSHGQASRLEYVSEIIKIAGLSVPLEAVAASSFKRLAKVSNNEMADNWKLRALKIDKLRDWRICLREYMQTINSNSGELK